MRIPELHTLPNGIRVIHNRTTTSRIVHCGIMLDIGSRDETTANQGIAHFWEHMAFKGTRKRKAFHINHHLESVGGELNAFTDKEKIFFYATVREEYFERAFDLLADIAFASVFPETQLQRERQVILEEMSMYHDDPDDSLQDVFDALIFRDHSLGMNILGTPKTVSRFKRSDFLDFISSHLDSRRIVFSSVGNFSQEQVVTLAKKYLGKVPPFRSRAKRKPFRNFRPDHQVVTRSVRQARFAIGRPALSGSDERRGTLFLLISILGGPAMNSRLNQALREKRGLVYSVGAQFVPFTDTGLLVISFGTEPAKLDISREIISRELGRLRSEKLGIRQLATAREQMLGQIAMAEENNVGFMIMMARTLLDLGRVPSIEETFDRIRKPSAIDLADMADELLDERNMSTLIMMPDGSVPPMQA
ncbi:MAG: insulinase family protein [Cyclobacteriaceae bacterium]|nr:insulinase family protein [Cyclobacteriaceae bacterium]